MSQGIEVKDLQEWSFPSEPHEFLGAVVESVRRPLLADLGNLAGKEHLTLNLMYSNPRLGAMMHFMPGAEASSVAEPMGVGSAFFKHLLKESKKPLPLTEELLNALVELAMSCPYAMSAAANLRKKKTTNNVIEQLVGDGLSDHELLLELLKMFSEVDENRLTDLCESHVLLDVIQCLLSFLPQFEDFKDGAMGSSNGERPGTMEDGIRWLTDEEKISLWNPETVSSDARAPLFYLLSVVESLQWYSGTGFGIIDSVFEFLQDGADAETRKELELREVPLRRMALYFNCPKLNKQNRKRLNVRMRGVLLSQIDLLSHMVATLTTTASSHARMYFEDLNDSPTGALSQALLGVLSPQYLFYADAGANGSGRCLAPTSSPGYWESAESVQKVVSILTSPWGIYDEDPTSPLKVEHGTMPGEFRYGITGQDFAIGPGERATKGGFACMRLTGESPPDIEGVKNGKTFLGKLILDIGSTVCQEPVPRTPWHKGCFDSYYIAVDKARMSDLKRRESKLRYEREKDFYEFLLRKHLGWPANPPKILEMGVGYGRLAEKFKAISPSLLDSYYGIDCSEQMITDARQVIPEDRLARGEFCTVRKRFPDLMADLVIFSFSTFGVYSRNEDNENALFEALSLLRPNGIFVVEQHNPRLETAPEPVLSVRAKLPNEQDTWLLKTTSIVRHSDYTSYAGEYVYAVLCSGGARQLRCDPYHVRLYSAGWFREVLGEQYLLRFHADFHRKTYNENDFPEDALLGCCVGFKLARPRAELAELLQRGREVADRMSSSCEDVYKEYGLGKIADDRWLPSIGDNLLRVSRADPTEDDVMILQSGKCALDDEAKLAAEIIKRIAMS